MQGFITYSLTQCGTKRYKMFNTLQVILCWCRTRQTIIRSINRTSYLENYCQSIFGKHFLQLFSQYVQSYNIGNIQFLEATFHLLIQIQKAASYVYNIHTLLVNLRKQIANHFYAQRLRQWMGGGQK